MNKILILIFLAFYLVGCSSLSANKGNGYNITSNASPQFQGDVSIEYFDHTYLVKETKTNLNNRFASEAEIQSEIRRLPKGGKIYIRINRDTIGSANTENFEFVVFKAGNEIYRSKGDYDIPNTPLTPNGMWWNIISVPIEKAFDEPVTDSV